MNDDNLPTSYEQPPAPPASDFPIQVAQRVTRLPPYLFGRINKRIHEKRTAGDDVIDLGMGNPTDPPQELVIDKLVESRPRSAQPPLQQVQRHHQPPPRGGRQVPQEVRRAARPRGAR